MDCLVFDSQEKVTTAERQIWKNIVVDVGAENIDKINGLQRPYSSLAGMSDDDIKDLKILGQSGENIETERGKTTGYSQIRQIYNQNLWWIPKPEEQYMTDVAGFQNLQFDYDWLAPVEL